MKRRGFQFPFIAFLESGFLRIWLPFGGRKIGDVGCGLCGSHSSMLLPATPSWVIRKMQHPQYLEVGTAQYLEVHALILES